jgi:malonate decarboxylase delta subunit
VRNMPLNIIEFSLDPQKGCGTIGKEWSHNGVVGSGDMEVLLRRKDSPSVEVRVTTPVTGFDNIWKAVLSKSVSDANVGGLSIEINDNNATPFVVAMRLKQSFAEAGVIADKDACNDLGKDSRKDTDNDSNKNLSKDSGNGLGNDLGNDLKNDSGKDLSKDQGTEKGSAAGDDKRKGGSIQ